MLHNLTHIARTYPDATPIAHFLRRKHVRALLASLGVTPDTSPGPTGSTLVPAPVARLYLIECDASAAARILSGEDVPLPDSAPSRPVPTVRGRLAGIDALAPGEAMDVSCSGDREERSLRPQVSALGAKLGRRFACRITPGKLTITRVDAPETPPDEPAWGDDFDWPADFG